MKAEREMRARRAVPEGAIEVKLELLPSAERTNRLSWGQKRWWCLDVETPNPDSPSGKGVFVDIEAFAGRKLFLWQPHEVKVPLIPGREYVLGSGANTRIRFFVDLDTEVVRFDPQAERFVVQADPTRPMREPGEDDCAGRVPTAAELAAESAGMDAEVPF
jgi:hypothetical protein